MGRARRTEMTRTVGAQVPVSKADRFTDLCQAVGVSQTTVVMTAIENFLAEHDDALPAQDSLLEDHPLAQAS